MAEGEKGTVIHLNSLFTSDAAEKAARRVEDAIADRQRELCRLRGFNNSVLIQHVQKLPEELSHHIMVPFGGAAFFPGRLIHTNEFLVLLGEGYHAERTAKQTMEILQRRGRSLEAQLESLNRIIKDLEVEAKFFDSTAAEVAEGLVEIREDYIEENIQETQSKEPESVSNSRFMNPSNAHNSGVLDEEVIDAKLMARLDELEKEEEEAASDLDDDEDDKKASSSNADEVDDDKNGSYLRVDKDGDDEDDKDVDEASYSKAVEDEVDEEENDEDKHYNAENTSQTNDEVPTPKVIGPRKSVPTSMQHNALGLLQHPSYQSSASSSKMQVAAEETIEDFQKPSPYIQNSSENILSRDITFHIGV
ncbi:RNA polymerase II subunit 5-mediating protein homolog [Phalaenopsis equestris]|uniref:RNA polymerase II subunit 5-mediating protein homolog n=1 Tax=Phalaenopsis equestris TaxID=78828 RepID=UPI0009E48F13|nr:RNA polymerase II subunit 5-mediating protein homolog [Phalaenopsis equestris]